MMWLIYFIQYFAHSRTPPIGSFKSFIFPDFCLAVIGFTPAMSKALWVLGKYDPSRGHATPCHPPHDLILSCVIPWFSIWWFIVLSQLSYRQDKRMDELNIFIDYHYKSIVSIIWARHALTLHLSHANWGKLKLSLYWQLQECSCMLCNLYQIESYHSSLKLSPF